MKIVSVSVPGKVHMMGEHAVVYGKPALLAAINRRLTVTITTQKHPLTTKNIIIHSTESIGHAMYTVSYLLKTLQASTGEPIDITIDSSIPAGYHLGSSAALAVGLSAAVLYWVKNIWNPVRINELAYEIEKKQHGNPSGGDNTVVTVGGFVWFRKELEFLKSIWQLPFKPHASTNHFFLIDTGRPHESTGDMVAYVAENVRNNPSVMAAVFDRNEQQVKSITLALKDGRQDDVIRALREGERSLEDMGVVSPTVLPLIREIERRGGGVKILGGGGRSGSVGFLLCYHSDQELVASLCDPYGYTIQQVVLGEEGVRLEKT